MAHRCIFFYDALGYNTSLWPPTYPLFELRKTFYLVLPSEIAFSSMHDVPPIMSPSSVAIFPFLVLEFFVGCRMFGWPSRNFDVTDRLASMLAILMTLVEKSFTHLVEFRLYEWVYANYALVAFEPSSLVLFFGTLISIDFLRYWEHRAWHENAVLWEIHRIHHSSEHLNFFTASRTSYFHQLATLVIYTPLAFFVPPAQFYVHNYINYIYPFWVHTEVVPKLGVLEKVLVTPSHHRVHHGRNRYCIDRNYSHIFIFWDQLFGTFAEERDGEEIVYGVIKPVNSYNTVAMHFDFSGIYEKWRVLPTATERIRSLIMGPGWMPGKPRLGDLNDVPDVSGKNAPKKFFVAHDWRTQLGFLVQVLLVFQMCLHSIRIDRPSNKGMTVFTHISTTFVLFSLGRAFDGIDRMSICMQAVAQLVLILYSWLTAYSELYVILSLCTWIVDCYVYSSARGKSVYSELKCQ